MECYQGVSICKGLAIGKVFLNETKQKHILRQSITNIEDEVLRFRLAQEVAEVDLKNLQEKVVEAEGKESASIFKAHQFLLVDAEYVEAIIKIIKEERICAEFAIQKATDQICEMLESINDEVIRARAWDVRDISQRLIDILGKKESNLCLSFTEPRIILAQELTPSELISMDKDKVLGLITTEGSSKSHLAILARNRNIPTIIQVNMDLVKRYHEKEVLMDADTGRVYLDPVEEKVRELMQRYEIEVSNHNILKQFIGKENVDKDGRIIDIYANVGSLEEVKAALEQDAGGIGLFRSEFLFMGKDVYPSEEEQFLVYKKLAQMMSGKKVVIRTFDIGSDKIAECFPMKEERNPALGYRGVRIYQEYIEVFKTQLRAIYRASPYGNLSIMLPMVISREEIISIKNVIEAMKKELMGQNIECSKVDLGIMIETPAAAMISDTLASEVDFFSIGTNDLIQFTLAVDRENNKLDPLYDAYHPAILRLIKLTVDNAHKQGIKVGICGEMASDLSMTETFLNIGIDELSVAPMFVLPLRQRVHEIKKDTNKID